MTTPEQIAGPTEADLAKTSILTQVRADGYREGAENARLDAAQRAMTAYDEAYYKGHNDGREHYRLKKWWPYVFFAFGLVCGGLVW